MKSRSKISSIKKPRAKGVRLSSCCVTTLLNAIVCCSVRYADICERLLSRAGSDPCAEECADVVATDRRIREIVLELKTKLGIQPRRSQDRKRSGNISAAVTKSLR